MLQRFGHPLPPTYTYLPGSLILMAPLKMIPAKTGNKTFYSFNTTHVTEYLC